MMQLTRDRKKKAFDAIASRSIDEDVLCSVALAQMVAGKANPAELNKLVQKLADWYIDCPFTGRDPRGESDFAAIKLVRFLYTGCEMMSKETIDKIIAFFANNNFESKYKSENHMLLFHVSRYLVSQKLPDIYYKAFNKTGEQLLSEDKSFLLEYVRFRAKRGWAEFDSLGYYAEDMKGLVTLFDFAQDEELKNIADMGLNYLLLDMLNDSMGCLYCGAHGRIYEPAAFDYASTLMFAVYWLYFGHEYEQAAVKILPVEFCLSDYLPADYVYDVYRNKPKSYENFESKHLHCISTAVPHEQVEQVEGSINKYTYITEAFAIGAVNFQDDYPADSDAKWYAHHEQHEWDLTLAGGTDIRIFTHHPGKHGTEGQEHGYWTGDLECCCGHFFCNKNIAMAEYDIPEGEQKHINASIPFWHFKAEEKEHYLFLQRDNIYVSLWFSNGYKRVTEGEYTEREIRSFGSRHAVVCEVGLESEYESFESFQNHIMSQKIEFDAVSMELSYKDMYMSKTERRLGGKTITFPYPTFYSPFVKSKFDSGIIYIKASQDLIEMDFNNLRVTKK